MLTEEVVVARERGRRERRVTYRDETAHGKEELQGRGGKGVFGRGEGEWNGEGEG